MGGTNGGRPAIATALTPAKVLAIKLNSRNPVGWVVINSKTKEVVWTTAQATLVNRSAKQ